MMARALAGVVPSQPKEFGAFVGDEETRAAVLQAAADAGLVEPHVVQSQFEDALRRLRKIPTPRILVVDLSGCPDMIADITRLSEVCDEGTHVIALGDVNDINLYRQFVGVGLHDYFVKPIVAANLAAAMTNAGKGAEAAAPGDQVGHVVSIIGARGGVGASSLAVNVAWLLANEHKRRVALVDLDLFFGTCGLALDLDLGRGFREALENPSRIDGLFIERAMMKCSDKLFVLCAEEALECAINFDATAVELLIDHLRRDFQFVIVDMPRFAARTQSSILTPPASVAIVTDPSLAGMRDTMRLVSLLKKVAPKADPSVVLNRFGANASAELTKADFEKGAEAKVSHVIPYDPKTFGACASTGKALAKVAAGSRASKAVATMAGRLVAAKAPAAKGKAAGLLQRFLGGART